MSSRMRCKARIVLWRAAALTPTVGIVLLALCTAPSRGAEMGLPAQASTSAGNGTLLNWPEFHLANNRDGFNASETALNVTNVGHLELRWSYATGSAVYSSAAVVNGVVYVGSYDFNVYALNASTGAVLWSYPTGSVVYSSPAVANGVV